MVSGGNTQIPHSRLQRFQVEWTMGITMGDGIKQTTYKGRPLYYFANDVAAGDMNGEGVNTVWHVIYPGKIKR